MQHLGNGRDYSVRQQLSWLARYRLWHTVVLVFLTGMAGWYAVYMAVGWLLGL